MMSLPKIILFHRYFPALVKAINGSVAVLQHAPSNTGALAAGINCWNITTLLGATGSLPQPWDLIVFNFGLHVRNHSAASFVAVLAITDAYHVQDTKEWTPPPSDDEANDHGDDRSTSVDKYMVLLRRYTELVLYSGRAKKALWASTTPMMHVSYFQLCPSDHFGSPDASLACRHNSDRALNLPQDGIWRTLEIMNANASTYMASVGVPQVDLWSPIVKHCGPLPYSTCDIVFGSTSGQPANASSNPHYTAAGYDLLVEQLVPAIKAALKEPTFLPTVLKSDDGLLVWPPVQSMNASGAALPLHSDFAFVIDAVAGSSPLLQRAVQRYSKFLAPVGATTIRTDAATLTQCTVRPASSSELLRLNTDYSYTLDIDTSASPSCSIVAPTVYGCMAGLETFTQLLNESRVLSNSHVSLSDHPDFVHRGVMIDAGRRFAPLSLLFNVVDVMSWSKMNVLHLHASDM